jgi:hypothetical protein
MMHLSSTLNSDSVSALQPDSIFETTVALIPSDMLEAATILAQFLYSENISCPGDSGNVSPTGALVPAEA